MSSLNSVWLFIRRRKYLITLLAFGAIIGIVDENSWTRRWQYEREIQQLRKEIDKYRNEYEESTRMLQELTANPEAIERIAREKYLMKKPNEDIFVFED